MTELGITANGQSLITAANYAAMRTLLDLEAGTDFNAFDALLSNLSTLGDNLVSGDIVYATAANTLVRLAKGTDDQILKLASGVPSWADEGSGAIQEIAEGTFTAVANVDFAYTPASWRRVLILLGGVEFGNNNVSLDALVSTDGGSNFAGANYKYAQRNNNSAGTTTNGRNSESAAGILLSAGIGNENSRPAMFTIEIPNPALAENPNIMYHGIDHVTSTGSFRQSTGGGNYTGAGQDTDAIRVAVSAGVFSGSYKVLGIAE
jgi:hypothetical protein